VRLAALRQKSHCVDQYKLGVRPVRGQFDYEAGLNAAILYSTACGQRGAWACSFLIGGIAGDVTMTGHVLAATEEEQPNFLGFAGAFLAGRTADMDNDTGSAIEFYTARRWNSTRKTST
jgi:hypothetical protein